jgi:hypothetical protein
MAMPVALNGAPNVTLNWVPQAAPVMDAVPVALNRAPSPAINGAVPALPASPVANKPSLADTKAIQHGSYGCVVDPALPNKVNGEWKTFPGYISKLYYRPQVLDKALTDSETIYELLGKNKGHKMDGYAFKNYKTSNLPVNVRGRCKLPIVTEKPLHVARMPHLGYDILSIRQNYRKYRNVPVKTILEQTLKVIGQLRDLATAGKVHGDVRETNVMANPVNGDITLIDFDLLRNSDEFAINYREAFGFYNNPPEALLLHYFNDFKTATSLPALLELVNNNIIREASKYINDANLVLFRDIYNIINKDNLIEILFEGLEFMKANMDQTKDRYTEFMRVELPYFDSYGLGFTLLDFYMYVYNIPATNPLSAVTLQYFKTRLVGEFTNAQIVKMFSAIRSVVTSVLVPMCNPRIYSRISIFEAYDRMSAIVASYGMGGGHRRKTLRKRKQRRAKSIKRK